MSKETEKELELRLLKNFIDLMPKIYRKRHCNWVIVQSFLQQGTSKSGRNSSVEKCNYLGINPDGYGLETDNE